MLYLLVLTLSGMALAQNSSIIMVATGYSCTENCDSTAILDSAEVIDTNGLTTCVNVPENYPFPNHMAVSFKHNGKMVVCGGYDNLRVTHSDCYSFKSNQWLREPFQLQPARFATISVEIRPNEWMLMGGYAGGLLKTTQIFQNGIFVDGSDLPEESYGGSAVMLNVTHLFLASAEYGIVRYSTNNYLFNINTNEWTQIASRNLASFENYFHSSGIFYNSTANEVQVANIGPYGIEVYSPRDDSWHSDLDFPSPLESLSASKAIQMGTSHFYLIAGQDGAEYKRDIYKFDEYGFSIVKRDVLTIPRSLHVAIPISTNDFVCN